MRFFFLNETSTKLFTNKSLLILKDIPNTVANLKLIEFLNFIIIFSASTFVLPYKEIGFNLNFHRKTYFFLLSHSQS